MVADALFVLAGVCMFVGFAVLYCLVWLALLFMCWASVDDEDYWFAVAFGAGLLMWSGVGIGAIALVI